MRNQNIDYIRGLALFNIIFIHTVWYSGSFYLPEWLKQAVLLFEVPVFFFLAGWAYSYSNKFTKGVKNLGRLQLRYMGFVLVVSTVLWGLNGELSASQVFKWLFHINYADSPPIHVFMGSMWFMRVYLLVSLLCMSVLLIKNKKIVYPALVLSLACVIVVSPPISRFREVEPQGALVAYLSFYSFFYLLGYAFHTASIRWRSLAGACAGIGALLFIFHHSFGSVLDLQMNKFPPNPVFLLWSLFSILLVLKLKDYNLSLFKPFYVHVGQNAIYYYFGQGLSSSALYLLLPYINKERPFLTLIFFFGVNLILCIFFSEAIRLGETLFLKTLNQAASALKRFVSRVALCNEDRITLSQKPLNQEG